ncbi:MAG: rod shape-determining protein MreD [Caldilineaceae bacterium]|nr:rod shape-determining protein MreD [Caldilineaceae bacterium]
MGIGIQFYLMAPLLGVASILQTTTANRLVVAGVKPDLVLLIVVIWTLIYGGSSGVVWAFVGGIWLDIFSGGPMGISSLSLMTAAVVASFGHRTFSRFNLLVPILAIVLGTLSFSFTYLGILQILAMLDVSQGALPFQQTFDNIVAPSVLYNTTLMLIAMPFLNRIPDNYAAERNM